MAWREAAPFSQHLKQQHAQPQMVCGSLMLIMAGARKSFGGVAQLRTVIMCRVLGSIFQAMSMYE